MHHLLMLDTYRTAISGPAHTHEDALLEEQISLLYRNAPSIFFGNLAGGLGMALMLWENSARQQLLTWLLALSCVTVLRGLLVMLFGGRFRSLFPAPVWAWLFVAGAAASGAVWGLLSVLSFDTTPSNLAGIGLVLAGLVAASASALATCFPAYLAFAVPAILPFALRCGLTDHPTAPGMTVVAVAFLLSSLFFGWLNNRTILQGLHLRCDNLMLVRRLCDQTAAAEKARELAESADAAKTRFLATASHDLRQPLQSIALLAETLQLEKDPQTARQLLGGIQEASESMSQLMNELLDYTHIHAGGVQATHVSFDLAELIRRITAEFQPLARDKNLELRSYPRHARVRSDPGLVERILRNLLSNAIKYTHQGGVLIGVRRRGNHMRIEVWDTGKGIPPELLEDVFHEFYQLDNPERDSRKGLGLGLAIVASLAELLKIKVGARSREQRGSLFSLELPIDCNYQPQVVKQPRSPLPEVGTGTVLIIDNEPAILQAMVSLLRAWGFGTLAAESGEQALALLGGPPDAILADFRLRDGHTGIEAISLLRAHFGQTIPAALITGDTDPSRLAEARAQGLPLLQKPTAGPALFQLLTQLIQQRAA